ncbi:MAG: rhomboid family intramembrane serine protease, partial [Bacteroidota bacterium]
LSISSDAWKILTRPWTIITHMFMHTSFGHIFWNMLFLYWFGRIVGDFIGDDKILPLYMLGGLVGAVFYYLSYNLGFGNTGVSGIALGASAAVMTFVAASAWISPEYEFNLLLIGRVKIMYVALVIFVLDLITLGARTNTGGVFAHMGGFAYGALYVYMRRRGVDLTEPFLNGIEKVKNFFNKNNDKKAKKAKSPVYVKYKAPSAANKKNQSKKQGPSKDALSHEEQLNKILEKIKQKGYDSLSAEEKDFLIKASKK